MFAIATTRVRARRPFFTVASAAVAAGIADEMQAALEAMEAAPIVTENNARVQSNYRVSSEGAVKLFDWLYKNAQRVGAGDEEE